MNNFVILNLQDIAAFLVIYLGFRWWIFPKVADLPIHQALLPFVFIHGIRYLGLTFMVEHQIYDEFPKDTAQLIGLWDYSVAIFAMITAYTLKIKWKYAIPLVWVFNTYGVIDLMVAFPKVFAVEFYKHDIGGIWFLFIIVGPITMISHIYIYYRLFKEQSKKTLA